MRDQQKTTAQISGLRQPLLISAQSSQWAEISISPNFSLKFMAIRFALPNLLLCWLMGAGSLPASADPISKSMRREDSRLERRVTLTAASIQVGELLERLTQSTGVSLLAGYERDGTADEKVSVFIRNVPLGNLMDGLYSLLSYRIGEWHWQRTGAKGNYRYRFLQTRQAQILAIRLGEKLQSGFEDHAAKMLSAIEKSPVELEAYLRQDPVAATLLNSDRLRAGLSVFASTLSPDVRLAVLRGQAEPLMQVSQLPPDAQRFVQQVSRTANARERLPDGSFRPLPDPTWVRFKLSKFARTVAPVMLIEIEGRGAYGYLGGPPLARAYLDSLEDLWMLPGDAREDSRTQARVSAPRDAKGGDGNDAPLVRRFAQLSAARPVSILARVASASSRDPGSPYDQVMQEYLRKLRDEPFSIHHKWRSGMLLLSDASWFKERIGNRVAPYQIVKTLRQSQIAGDGYLSLADLGMAASELSEAQLRSIADEFPEMEQVAYWRPVFRLYHQSKTNARQLESPRGLVLQGNPDAIRLLILSGYEPFLQAKQVAAIGLRQIRREKADPDTRIYSVQLLGPDGKKVGGASFSQRRKLMGNLCLNGGFEEVEELQGQVQPKDWIQIGGADRQSFLSSSARAGRYAGRLVVDDQVAVGMNWLCKEVTAGTVQIWYQAIRSGAEGENLCFYVVPMREVDGKLNEVVGPNQRSARVRFQVPTEHVGDGRWHRASIAFDFGALGARHTVFAPRVNELVAASGAGEILFDDVEIIATRK